MTVISVMPDGVGACYAGVGWAPCAQEGVWLRAGDRRRITRKSMQSFLAKCAAVGIVAGGFAATGDLGRLAQRGQRLLEARTVPHEPTAEAATEAPEAAAAVPAAAASATFERPPPAQPFAPAGDQGPVTAAQSPSPASPAAGLFAAPDTAAALGRPVAVPAPPSAGPDSIDVRRLAAGQRVRVWLRKPGLAAAGRAVDLLALDIIDPETAAALEYRHLAEHHAPTAASTPAAVHAAPRRIVIGPADAGRITKGTDLRVAPVRGVHGTGPVETLGTVVAIDLQGP
jgi:hypothetical protein